MDSMSSHAMEMVEMTDMNPSSEEVGKRQKTTFSWKKRGK